MMALFLNCGMTVTKKVASVAAPAISVNKVKRSFVVTCVLPAWITGLSSKSAMVLRGAPAEAASRRKIATVRTTAFLLCCLFIPNPREK